MTLPVKIWAAIYRASTNEELIDKYVEEYFPILHLHNPFVHVNEMTTRYLIIRLLNDLATHSTHETHGSCSSGSLRAYFFVWETSIEIGVDITNHRHYSEPI